MKILLKLFPTLKDYTPAGFPAGERFALDLPGFPGGDATVRDLITHLNIPAEGVGMAIVNGVIVKDLDHPLKEGDVVFLSPLVSGG